MKDLEMSGENQLELLLQQQNRLLEQQNKLLSELIRQNNQRSDYDSPDVSALLNGERIFVDNPCRDETYARQNDIYPDVKETVEILKSIIKEKELLKS